MGFLLEVQFGPQATMFSFTGFWSQIVRGHPLHIVNKQPVKEYDKPCKFHERMC